MIKTCFSIPLDLPILLLIPMIHSRLLMLMTASFAGWSVFYGQVQPSQAKNNTQVAPISQYLAQTPTTSPTVIDPLELLNPKGYDTYMKEGEAALKAKEYDEALEKFNQALKDKPNDTAAKQAIQTVETARQESAKNPLPDFLKDPRWAILTGIGLIGAIATALFLLNRRSSPQLPKFKKEQVFPKNTQNSTYNADFSAKSEDKPYKSDDSSVGESSFPLQTTTRIPNPELVEELIRELQHRDPKRRRKAIWKLAQKADSRAMKPLVELMIETDSFERNLILEALSQISTRTIKPMNQALALSLQDKNPQVRKNAIRDLTRLYDMMSQVSQLLCHAIEDQDEEVKETAKWALNQLNLQMPPRLDLLLNKDDENFRHEPLDDETSSDSTSVEY